MLEVGENPTLCRNGKSPRRGVEQVRYSYFKSPEQERDELITHPFVRKKGFKLRTAENFAETYPGNVEFNRREAKFEDTATWLAEVMDGQMHTEFSFQFDGQELIGEDGRKLGEIFDKSIEDTEAKIKTQPQMAFELRRNKKERGEYDDMIDMMLDKKPNTMIILSDFPPELMDQPKDVGGYNVRRRQTMMRIITKNEDDTLTIQSQSLDGSYRFALESIYDSLGQKPEPGELLGQRIHVDLPPAWQKQLNDNLKGKYDQALDEQFGGEWEAGRQPAEYENTYDFVVSQKPLIDAYIDKYGDDPDNDVARYNLAAAMEARFRNRANPEAPTEHQYQQIYNLPNQLDQEMINAGQMAKDAGKSYSGCGLTLDALSQTEANLKEAGYGSKEPAGTQESYSFDKKMYCLLCQSPPEEGDEKKWCGPCGFCEDCDTVLKEE